MPRFSRQYSLVAVMLVVSLSGVMLADWLFQSSFMPAIDNFPTMKANTALCFLLLSIVAGVRVFSLRCSLCEILLAVVFVFSGLTLIEYALGVDFFIDQMLAVDEMSEVYPGRMSAATAVNFLVMSFLLLGLGRVKGRLYKLYDTLFIIYLWVCIVALLSYLLSPEELFEVRFFSTLSLPSLLCFFSLASIILVNVHDRDSMISLMTLDSNGARRFRFLLVFTLILPLLLGLLLFNLSANGFFGTSFAIALYIVLTLFSVCAGLIYSARREDQFYRNLEIERERNFTLQQKLSSVLDESDEALLLFSSDGKVINSNRGASRLFGWTDSELMNMNVVQMIPERLRGVHAKHVNDFVNSDKNRLNNDNPLRMVALHKDGTEVPILTTITKKYLGDEMLIAFAAKNASWLQVLVAELGGKAYRDALTGVYNRHAYEQMLKDSKMGQRISDQSSVLMIDIDYFKKINDTWGHDVGDRVLKKVAAGIADCLRLNEQLFRYGGEEFVVILPGMSKEAVSQLGERIRRAVEALDVTHEGKIIQTTCSIGVATANDCDTSILDVVKRADQALYQAKQRGRNQVVIDIVSI